MERVWGCFQYYKAVCGEGLGLSLLHACEPRAAVRQGLLPCDCTLPVRFQVHALEMLPQPHARSPAFAPLSLFALHSPTFALLTLTFTYPLASEVTQHYCSLALAARCLLAATTAKFVHGTSALAPWLARGWHPFRCAALPDCPSLLGLY